MNHSRKPTPHLDALRRELKGYGGRTQKETDKQRAALRFAIEQESKQGKSQRPSIPVRFSAATPRWAVSIAAVMVLGLALLFIYLSPKNGPVSLEGLLYLSKQTIDQTKQFKTQKGGAKMVYPDQTAVWLGSDTTVKVNRTFSDPLDLKEGALLAAVTPQGSNMFAIETPHGSIQVHGTVFSVRAHQDQVRIRLHDGKVTFAGTDRTLQLQPGDELFITKGRPPKVTAIDDAGLLQDLMIAAPTVDLPGPKVPLIGKNIRMSPLDITGKRPVTDKPPQTAPKKRAQKTAKPAPAPEPETPPEKPAFVDPELLAIEVEIQQEAPSKIFLRLEDRLESLIQNGRYLECIRLAEKAINHPHRGKPSPRVLYLLGYCEMRSGNLKKGKAAFEDYLIQFPSGRQQKRIQEILGE